MPCSRSCLVGQAPDGLSRSQVFRIAPWCATACLSTVQKRDRPTPVALRNDPRSSIPHSHQLIRTMRRPKRRRDNPKARVVRPPPDGVDLDAVAERATYESSPYHSTVARIRRPRPDANKCPPEVSRDLQRVELWLREAIAQGRTGVWEKGYPRYAWCRVGDVIYEARQGSPGSGVYHGYPLHPEQSVGGLP